MDAAAPGPVRPVRADARDWIHLLRAPGLGAGDLRRMVDRLGSPAAVLDAGAPAWQAMGLKAPTRAWLRHPDHACLDADLAWLARPGHHLLAWDDPDYPALLRQAPSPPAALWVVGDPTALWLPQVAIVGSRNASPGGRDTAASFARSLAGAGMAITSGLALGIDAAAHAATLAAGGRTLAVMGTGPDRIYPSLHRDLAARIADSGCLATEFLPGTGPRRSHFPSRNRIVAGLCLGVLVVEAAQRSGALITARLAAEAGREACAIPGSIHHPLARGCHRLIRDGALLVETPDDLLAALAPLAARLAGELRGRLALGAPSPTPTTAPRLPPGEDYARLWDALEHAPLALDRLAERSGLTVEGLSSMLALMELEGLVVAGHGRYARRS